MLKDRIVVDENGFQVNRESADPERKAYYATFTLADEEIDKSQGKQIKYWDAMNPYSQRVQPNSYVYIWETKDEIMVDECRIYLGNGKVLHASQTAGKVKISTFSSSSRYWDTGCNAAGYCVKH